MLDGSVCAAPLLKPIVGNTDEDYTKRSTDRFKSDFIWNTNWQDQVRPSVQVTHLRCASQRCHEIQQPTVRFLQAKLRDEKAEEAASSSSKTQKPSGFLSFSRVADLNDMNVDLSKQLMEKPKPLLPPRSPASTVPLDPLGGKGQLYAIPPTSAEVKSWARSSGYRARNAGAAQALEGDNAKEAREEAAKVAADAFEASKKEMQLWTSVTAAVCTGLAYSFYTRVCCRDMQIRLKLPCPVSLAFASVARLMMCFWIAMWPH